MGTRGYIVHRYRGRYYIRYNHFDSYYEVLGVGVVAGIPSDKEEYQSTLEGSGKRTCHCS